LVISRDLFIDKLLNLLRKTACESFLNAADVLAA
jgi:hypothetical protein